MSQYQFKPLLHGTQDEPPVPKIRRYGNLAKAGHAAFSGVKPVTLPNGIYLDPVETEIKQWVRDEEGAVLLIIGKEQEFQLLSSSEVVTTFYFHETPECGTLRYDPAPIRGGDDNERDLRPSA